METSLHPTQLPGHVQITVHADVLLSHRRMPSWVSACSATSMGVIQMDSQSVFPFDIPSDRRHAQRKLQGANNFAVRVAQSSVGLRRWLSAIDRKYVVRLTLSVAWMCLSVIPSAYVCRLYCR